MFDSFFLPAFLSALGLSCVAGPLGCVVVWRRMAYFGDTIAHSALLGVAVGLFSGLPMLLCITLGGIGIAAFLTLLARQKQWSSDTLLGIFAHSALALGLVTLSQLETVNVDLVTYLFGDVLSVGYGDVYWVLGMGAIVLSGLAAFWKPILMTTISPEIAGAEGIRVWSLHFLITCLIALTISVAMQIVGILLITSLLILPAAAARPLARTPESMAFLAALLGMGSVTLGLAASITWDTPTGPSMVLGATTMFVLTSVFRGIKVSAS
jgi:zinc transport system permease protein